MPSGAELMRARPSSAATELLPDGARFTPRYPLMRGLKYRASADLSVLLGLGEIEHSAPSPLVFSLPHEPTVPPAVVDGIFPSSDALPENLLRFYVHFSAPMQSGGVQDHIVLLGSDGQPVVAAFLELTTELWGPAMRRLTVLLDPGRIKRGVCKATCRKQHRVQVRCFAGRDRHACFRACPRRMFCLKSPPRCQSLMA